MKNSILNSVKLVILLAAGMSYGLYAAPLPEIKKELLYDKYTLADEYPYQNKIRKFQWDKISDELSQIDSMQSEPSKWGILQNYKNENGRAPLTKSRHTNKYKRIADDFGMEQHQGVPLYSLTDLSQPERYGQDGDLVRILEEGDDFARIEHIYFKSEWMVPKNYLYNIHNNVKFTHVVFIDITNQNIATLEKAGSTWLVRSMNPATTGLSRPPYQMSTPPGIFVLQQQKNKMMYYRDGTTEIAGYAPYASRFSTGAYMHGVPVNLPRTKEIEFSNTLGTTPRSHKCVRNATSHAKFIYDWAPVDETLVVVLE